MVWYALSSLKYQITNISGKGWAILLIFCMQLFASCWISIEVTKICYFKLALSGIGPQTNRLSDVSNLKNLKTTLGIKLIFCFHSSYNNYHAILGYAKNTLGQSDCKSFYFWLIWFVNLNTGGALLHCIINLSHLNCWYWSYINSNKGITNLGKY